MIRLHVKRSNMDIELRGSDETILDELSIAIIRVLTAIENNDGNPVKDNLTALILRLLAEVDSSCDS